MAEDWLAVVSRFLSLLNYFEPVANLFFWLQVSVSSQSWVNWFFGQFSQQVFSLPLPLAPLFRLRSSQTKSPIGTAKYQNSGSTLLFRPYRWSQNRLSVLLDVIEM